MKTLIDITLFFGTQEFAFCGHDETSIRSNEERTSEFLSSYDFNEVTSICTRLSHSEKYFENYYV